MPSGCTRFYRCEVVGAYSFRCPSQTLWDQVRTSRMHDLFIYG